MTMVKICGNRTPEDVLAAAAAGADFVGMVFAQSSRRVDAEEAGVMVRAMGEPLSEREMVVPPPAQQHVQEEVHDWFRHGARVLEDYLEVKRPLTVGVFADQPIDEVNEIVEESGIDLVQLSGDEPWEECLLVTRQTIRAMHVSTLDLPSDPMQFVKPGFAIALLLDTAYGPNRGGTGQTFDWEVARTAAGQVPLMLAGGLTPENVGEAIDRVRPWAVDVSSGTERDGRKAHGRVRAFVDAVRAAG